MLQTTISSRLLNLDLPGAWIASRREIWQMDFLSADKLGQYCSDRGLSHFSEEDITQLWHLGLVKADLILSRRKLKRVGLVDRGFDPYKYHLYSDERILRQRSKGWGSAIKTIKPLQSDVQLLFHPFRYFVLYHLNRVLGFNSSRMQMFIQEHYQSIVDFNLSMFNRWSTSEQFVPSINLWNDIASLTIVTEPYTYERIFHDIQYHLTGFDNIDNEIKQIRHRIAEQKNDVKELYHQIGMKRLEEIRLELCIDTQRLDPNRWIHTLLCLGDSKFRLELKEHLGGALLLRTMAEMLRRATEEAFDTTLREEDEIGFGWVPEHVKETIYGSNRLLDNQQAASTFIRRHGLNYKPRVHLYGEGNTEYGALNSFFKSMDVPVTNLHGLIKEGKSMVTFFRDSLRSDIKGHMYSIVVIDGDVRENVKILESAARNNNVSEDDGIFGRFFLSQPDFEFANFEIEELEEVLWLWVGGESPSQEERELLHSHIKAAEGSTEFFKGVKHVATQFLPRLIGYDKGEEWGEELMKYAWEHKFKQNKKRQIIETVELALHWEKTINLERFESGKKTYSVDPQTGRLVKRSI